MYGQQGVWTTPPLLFGTPRLVRYLTKESLSSKGGFCPLKKGIRDIFLEPEVIDNYRLDYRGVDEVGLYQFLCLERGFSEERVRKVIEGMNEGKRGLL